ncbi:muscular LMNA-interacting protein isoform X24 [Sus scrofa]|nr:muscular LMNA-interacting protein isoform X24 [Sus scrofa]XP_020954201.1 muscular LMNA-interacting protein isoform X24 [Sus scrofa]XP_020954202.1 muscular LMNA-interacting protein isoform X24 [Sus scrofa]XP_020954203.1 muscular LMNA-interacting protein isoform X24 [Sus scrofa]XP_020954204.1 muscular LMNA-interacting protein isoform X24 [Sus scrofa]XP_020954205.1 muscular LMNA-interacting protein isoform X24 [Sus scrofa]XP_020954206.1 muscular LMNA-interacting protein isoform X24 [Sus scrof
MQQSDLFKAEYVFIVDSEGEEEATTSKSEQGPPRGMSTTAARPTSLAISSSLASDSVRPKTRGADLQAPSHPEMPHGMAPQQKHGQFTSSPTASEQLACKPPAFSFVSPTNQKTPPAPVNLSEASVLEEIHTRRLDVTGALVEETATYFQTSAHSAPFSASKGVFSTSQFPHSTQLSGSPLSHPSAAQQKPGLTSEALKKTTAVTSPVLSPSESPRTSSSPASGASLKSNSASYIPVRIITHSLCPSPKPFPSLFHGSSSTVCSHVSSSGNLSKSGVKSPVPSRLSLLTAILKSNPSHQRPLSPASCPTFTLNSLTSSTLALDQKVKQTSPTPKKSLSSCSLRAGSPEQRENQVSGLSQQTFLSPFSTKAAPLPQTPSHISSSPVSLNVEKMPSPSSLKSSPMLSPLQTSTSSSAGLPPVPPPSSSPLSPKGRRDADLRDPGKPRNICPHPSKSASSASSSVSPLTNQRARLSSPEKCYHPSPALSNLINRSKRASAPLSGQGQTPSAPPPPSVSSAGSASLPQMGSSSPPFANLPTQALQLSPSALHSNLTLPSRFGKSESSISDHRSSVSTPPPPISLTRTKELISPCALSMSTGSENKKPKQYKTKSSYKAFAAIPTNILLLEQKALDEPVKTEGISKDNTLDPPLELCFPAQLRQQTEEVCATIDKVLQDSLSMHSSDSPSSSLQTLLSSDSIKIPTTLPRAAGRETKYANLSSPSSTVSETQLTKPGVIRPVPVKSKILLKKEEEIYEPNPFSKYLEDNNDFFSEQDVPAPPKPVSLHPLYKSRLHPPAKSLLHPQALPHADCLTPGPFGHLSSFSLSDEQNSHTLFSHNAFNKLSHPMVPIPEYETLDSKEQ